MSLSSGWCIDLLHESCAYSPCKCGCHADADESRAELAAEWTADLRADDA